MLLIKELWRRHRKCWGRCGGRGSRVSKVKIRTGSTTRARPSSKIPHPEQSRGPRMANQAISHDKQAFTSSQPTRPIFFLNEARQHDSMHQWPGRPERESGIIMARNTNFFLDHGINLRLGKCILDVLNTFKSIGSFFPVKPWYAFTNKWSGIEIGFHHWTNIILVQWLPRTLGAKSIMIQLLGCNEHGRPNFPIILIKVR